MRGSAELIATAKVLYSGPATGPLYTQDQVRALLHVAARRAARQAALRVAQAAEDLLPKSRTTKDFAASVRDEAVSMGDHVDVSVW